MFTDQDVRGTTKVCIIGKTIVAQLFPDEDPVGQSLRIRDIPFKVLGVLSPKGLFGHGIGPGRRHYHSLHQRDEAASPSAPTSARSPCNPPRPISPTSCSGAISDLLRQRHRLGANRDDDFTIRGQQEIADAATATTRIMTVLLGAIASVSLIVGGIGIMNIMLVSVTERTREIGIRMAVGAHGRDILLQFLIEAITLSSLGGVIGIVLGVGSAKLLSAIAGWPTLVSVTSVVLAFLFSAAVGVFFGFLPGTQGFSTSTRSTPYAMNNSMSSPFARHHWKLPLVGAALLLVACVARGQVTNQTKSLTLRECIERALENNLEIRSQRITPDHPDLGCHGRAGRVRPDAFGRHQQPEYHHVVVDLGRHGLGLPSGTDRTKSWLASADLSGKLPSGATYDFSAAGDHATAIRPPTPSTHSAATPVSP